MFNVIQKQIVIKSSLSNVWKSLVDYKEFGNWFKATFETPFVKGEPSRGHITDPGYDHIKIEITIQEMIYESTFSYQWHPFAVDSDYDYSQDEKTTVTFTLTKDGYATILHLKEVGFFKLPQGRRLQSYQMNEEGWGIQMENIKNYLEKR